MKLRLELTKCEGYGNCAAHLEEVFELDEWGYAMLKNDGDVPEGAEDRALRSVADCPVHAISVVG